MNNKYEYLLEDISKLKNVGKKVFGKYFSTRAKFFVRTFLFFFERCWIFRTFSQTSKHFKPKIFRESKNIFRKLVFIF